MTYSEYGPFTFQLISFYWEALIASKEDEYVETHGLEIILWETRCQTKVKS